ncbi:MAG: histidine kinase [Blautia sp.]|nr:histidine kinase [Blautia sp.]
MGKEMATWVVLLVPLLLQLLGLTLAVLIDPYISRRNRRQLLVIVVVILSLVIQNVVEETISGNRNLISQRRVVSVYGYIIRPVIIFLFMGVVSESRKLRLAWIPLGINAAVYMTAFFSKLSIWFKSDNTFQRGPLAYTCHVVSAFLMLWLLIVSLQNYSRIRTKESLIPAFDTLLIVLMVFLDTLDIGDLPVSLLTMSVVSSSLFYYIWLHLQFVREHERDFMAQQRIKIMMSQIQPHFMYNTLSTIQALCRIDPERAFDTIGKFSSYLRQNLDFLGHEGLIPFRNELKHTKVYAEIEMVRFPYIQVVYDTQDEDFYLPALTIQPLVENAIRHGVRVREEGLVTVRTRRTTGQHEIIIEDNGKGFDVEKAMQADDTHIGLRNVRERIEHVAKGTMEIRSVIGEGTSITIRIPATEGGAQ